jgi:amidase
MEDLIKWPARRLADAIATRQVSPSEVLAAHIARIEALNPLLNAIVLPRLDEAIEEARAAGRALADETPIGPLHGVPFTVKESIPVAGMPCTAGSALFADVIAQRDAPPVEALRRAGAILLGKTNVSELLAHPDSVNPRYGATRNPHDPDRTAGGSSGGEAAAIAAGMSPLGLGSDLGGSIRWPAHACGIAGLRPSRGAVPSAEHVPPPVVPGVARFATIGPLARTVDDLELILDLVARPAPERDADAVLGPGPPSTQRPGRIAVFEDDGLQPVARACREAVRRAADALAGAGHHVEQAAPPDARAIREAFDRIVETEFTGLSGGEVTDVGAYFQAWAALLELERRAHGWMAEHPVALAPVAPVPAFPAGGGFGDVDADGEPLAPGGKLTICTWANATGLPAVALPAGRDAAGLPVGVQVFARRGHDRDALAIARELEPALGGWVDPDDAPRSATAARA